MGGWWAGEVDGGRLTRLGVATGVEDRGIQCRRAPSGQLKLRHCSAGKCRLNARIVDSHTKRAWSMWRCSRATPCTSPLPPQKPPQAGARSGQGYVSRSSKELATRTSPGTTNIHHFPPHHLSTTGQRICTACGRFLAWSCAPLLRQSLPSARRATGCLLCWTTPRRRMRTLSSSGT